MTRTPPLPAYEVPARSIIAMEHPMIIKNIDNGLKTFGNGVPIHQILELDDYDTCFPLYLRPQDPSCAPILSHNAATTNVLLKITAPKRTGLKRKRGSNGPFLLINEQKAMLSEDDISKGQDPSLKSYSRLDKPEILRKILQDCEGRFEIEPVGTIDHTHRYRGLSDFHYSTTHSPFMTKVRDTIMTGNLQKVKQFHLDPSRGVKPMEDLIPPPTFSDHTLPFNWAYHQNEHIRRGVDPTSGQTVLINYSAPKKMNTYYIPHTTISVPKEPQEQLSPSEAPILEELLTEMRIAFEERPIWTRRALGNRVGQRENSYNFRRAMSYVGYQFRGGPWRDGVIKYGVDPRTDTQYRIYQTLFFKIFDEAEKGSGVPWMDGRIEYSRKPNDDVNDRNSHIFDGTSVKLDGKVWQICDITDPLLSRLLSTNNLRSDCDVDVDGWFCNGTMAKVKAIMRAKISAIRLGRSITEQDFKTTLQIPDHVEGKTSAKKINVPVPDWRVERDQKGKLGVDASLSGLRRREAKNEKGIGTRGNNKIRVGSARGGRGGSVETRGGEGDEGGEGSVDTYGDGNSQGEHDAEGDLEAATPEIIPVVRERRKKTSGKMRVGSRLWRRKPEDRETFGALPAATQVPISAAAIPGFYGGGPLGREAGSKSSISQDDSIATDTNEGRTGSIGAATSGSVAEVDPRILETMHALNDQGGFETIEEGQFEKALGNPFLPGEFVDEDEGDDGEEDEVEEEDEDMDDEQDPEEEDDMDDGEDAF